MNKFIKILKIIGNMILWSFKWIYSGIEKAVERPIIAGILLLIFIGFFVINTSINRGKSYEGEFLDNVLVEAHGLLFDIFVFAILIVLFNKLGERRRDIKRYKEEIDDYRRWDEKEATFRIVGIIKRLQRAGVSHIDLSHCYLVGASLRRFNLKNFDLSFANLNHANLSETNLQNAFLWGTNLQKSHLYLADLKDAKLMEANLQKANLLNASLERADLTHANLQGVQNLTIEQLSNVKTLQFAILDPILLEQVRVNYPQLLEEPR